MKALSLLKALLGPGPGRRVEYAICKHQWRQQGAKKHCKLCGYYVQANGVVTSVASYRKAQRLGGV